MTSLPDKLRALVAALEHAWTDDITDTTGFYDKHAITPLIEALVRVADIADKYYRGADCSCDNCFQCDFAKALADLERLVEGETNGV